MRDEEERVKGRIVRGQRRDESQRVGVEVRTKDEEKMKRGRDERRGEMMRNGEKRCGEIEKHAS